MTDGRLDATIGGVTKSSPGGEQRLHLSVICEAPPVPPGFVFGLQDKSGSLHPGVEERDGSLRFEGEIRAVKLGDGNRQSPRQIVHGHPGAFFLTSHAGQQATRTPDGCFA